METVTAEYVAQQRADGIVYDNDGAPGYASEFVPGQYNTALISRLFENTFKSAYDALKEDSVSLDFEHAFFIFIEHFNDEFRKIIHDRAGKKCDSDFFNKMSEISVNGIDRLNKLKEYDHEFLADRDEGDAPRFVDILIDAYSAVVEAFEERECLYDPKLARTYLDSFFNLSKEMVFKEGSFNLTSSGFRRSFFLRTLLSFAAKREQWEVQPDPGKSIKEVPEEKRYIYPYYYSYFDPFAYDSIERALICATRILLDELRLNRERVEEDFFELRKQMFICSLEAAFQRSITLEHQAYRIELNRHSSLLLAYPVEPYSSTSDTKPIRLFEKTASYIRRNLPRNPDKRFDVVVTIVGHTGSNKEARRRSVTDYLAAVLAWYNTLKISGAEKLPPLRLVVNNIQNYIYKPKEWGDKRERITKSDNKILLKLSRHSASCSFSTIDYESYLAYSLKRTKKYIDSSQILFLLDCPWLSTENYSIRDEGAVGNYCARLHRQQRAYSEQDPLWTSDFKHYYEQSPMTELSNQFNRIMSSSNRNAGLVVRSMRDDLIHVIQEYMDDLRKTKPHLSAKELYVFSSENDGINYSYIDSYPLTRLEQYDGQHFTIIQFTNRQLPMLPCRTGENVKFEIDLWGVLKYLCIPYAYQYTVEKLFIKNGICWKDSAGEGGLRDPIQYLELLQNIVVKFDVGQDMKDISISFGFTELFIARLSECLPLENKDGGQTVQTASLSIEQQVRDLLRPLYLESVFAKNQKYSDDAIKMGFKMALYSAAKDARTMLFCRVYRDACESGDFSRFKVKFVQPSFPSNSEDSGFAPRDFASELFFADKKLYSCLLNTFKTDYNLTLGMFRMLEDSKDLFSFPKKDKSILKILLDNIKCSVEDATLTDSKLYLNLLRARYNYEG